MKPKLLIGDAITVMRRMPEASIDAIITDPPYGLGFMGKQWDNLPPGEEWARECLRVLKPGGHLLAFGGTRTWHRLAVAVEDAGFEIRDSIAWMYGSGFPKSLDVSKAIDKDQGHWRGRAGEVTSSDDAMSGGNYARTPKGEPITNDAKRWDGWGTALKPAHEPIIVARKPLQGTVAANVLRHGTGALNIDGCRIGYASEADRDQARVPQPTFGVKAHGAGTYNYRAGEGRNGDRFDPAAGRWPANVILDEDQAAALDAQSGTTTSRKGKPRSSAKPGGGWGMKNTGAEYDDQGGASRFFYCAKAPKNERPFYFRQSCACKEAKPCEEISRPRDTGESRSETGASWSTSTSGSSITGEQSRPDTTSTTGTATSSTTTSATSSSSPNLSTSAFTPGASSAMGFGGSPAESAASSSQSVPTTGTSAGRGGRSTDDAAPATSSKWSETSVCGSCGARAKRESHATVKPLSLMRWLVRLVTPPGGTVLDPFAGSGTTGEAAVLEGFQVTLIEREREYVPLIMARIARSQGPAS